MFGAEAMFGEHSMGTSLLACTYSGDGGGVVIGADSRTSTGQYIANRASDKLTPICDNVYVCRSGSAADTQALADMVKNYIRQHKLEIGENPEVSTVAKLFNLINYNNKDNLMAGLIVAGWDRHNRGTLYSIPLGGGLFQQNMAAGGSGSTYIYGYCDTAFKSDFSRAQAEEFVKTGLALAMSRDGSSGGVIRTATIDENGVNKQFFCGNDIPHFWEGA
jgi:20S proteasome subunit beta 1